MSEQQSPVVIRQQSDEENSLEDKNVVAVIVTWNKRDYVLRCIDSILASSYPLKKIIVIDNASTDGTSQVIKERFGESDLLYLVVNETNTGGSGGFYKGIEVALEYHPDYLWLLDNDIVVAQNTLQELVWVAEKEAKVGIVGSKVYFSELPNLVWSLGVKVSYWLATKRVIGDKILDYGQFEEILEVDYVPMCSMLLNREVIDKIGSVDPSYFVYSDDADFCSRAKQAEFRVLSASGSIAWHDVTLNSGSLSPFAAYYYTRNNIHFFLKFSPTWYKPVTTVLLFLFLTRRLLATVKYWPGLDRFVQIEKATLAGFSDAWRGKRGKVY